MLLTPRPTAFTFVSVDPLAVTCHLSPRHHHRHRRHLPLHYLYHYHTTRMNHQVGVLLPMLLASSYCSNLFTESCNSLIGESFAICATFMQRLRHF